ncbi:MAG: PrsW family intramembrane metalloprotease [Oscillibacter sp.]|nr:PrsW family intramembrane metalloprotease [Oscillibacter sp.]
MKHCIHCGTALPDGARFCSECGAKQGGAASPSPAAASMGAALDAAASMGEAMARDAGRLSTAAVLTPPAPAHTEPPSAAPGTASVPKTTVQPARKNDPVPDRQKPVPLHDRGALSAGQSRGKRILVNILLTAALAALQVGLIFLFSGFSDEGTDMWTAQAVGFAPVLLLLIYIFCLDTIEKEPIGLLIKLFILEGAFGMTVVVLAEAALDGFFADVFSEYVFTTAYRLFDAVFLVALVEELGKYIVLKRCTWKHPAFNYRFDGIVYAAVTALGFAAFENMAYVADSGLSTALLRAVSAVPGHCVDGILMGIFYGQAKCYDARGEKGKARLYRFLSVAVPVAEHGFYDFIAGIDSELVSMLFLCYVWLLNAAVFVAVWRQSQRDEAVAGSV